MSDHILVTDEGAVRTVRINRPEKKNALTLAMYQQMTKALYDDDHSDTVRCIEIACLNPVGPGECRVFNQFTEQFSVLDLANMVKAAAGEMGLPVTIDYLPSPRVEAQQHYYNAKHSKLVDLGLRPHLLSDSLLDSLMNIAMKYQDRVDQSLFLPQVNWRKSRNQRGRKQAAALSMSGD